MAKRRFDPSDGLSVSTGWVVEQRTQRGDNDR
jgi:hypothetical protein